MMCAVPPNVFQSRVKLTQHLPKKACEGVVSDDVLVV